MDAGELDAIGDLRGHPLDKRAQHGGQSLHEGGDQHLAGPGASDEGGAVKAHHSLPGAGSPSNSGGPVERSAGQPGLVRMKERHPFFNRLRQDSREKCVLDIFDRDEGVVESDRDHRRWESRLEWLLAGDVEREMALDGSQRDVDLGRGETTATFEEEAGSRILPDQIHATDTALDRSLVHEDGDGAHLASGQTDVGKSRLDARARD